MNKVILMGRLTKDPEIRYTQAAEPVCVAKFTLAVNRRFKKEGQPDADFINCTALGKTGQFIERFFKKGAQPLVCGRLQISTYDDKAGQRQYWTEVLVEEVSFTESKAANEARLAREGAGGYSDSQYGGPPPESYGAPAPSQQQPEGFSKIAQSIDEDDDLPF